MDLINKYLEKTSVAFKTGVILRKHWGPKQMMEYCRNKSNISAAVETCTINATF
jgi:hypothetical protein